MDFFGVWNFQFSDFFGLQNFGKYLFFLVAWFKRYFLGIQNNLKIHDNSYISRPRSSGNKLLWLRNSARDFLRVTFWSRDFLSFDFFPPFDHPCHLKSRVPSPRALPPPHQMFTEYHLPPPLNVHVLTRSVSPKSSSSSMVFTWRAPANAIPPLFFILFPFILSFPSVSFTYG